MPDAPDDLPPERQFADRKPADGEQPEKPPQYTRDVIDEALRRQAAMRKPLGPPKELQTPPTLPKQPRPYLKRNRRARPKKDQ